VVLNKQGKPKEAFELHKKVEAIRKVALGEEHPDYKDTLENIAIVLSKKKKLWPVGSFALFEGQVGLLTMAPDDDCNIKLRYTEDTTSDFIAMDLLSKVDWDTAKAHGWDDLERGFTPGVRVVLAPGVSKGGLQEGQVALIVQGPDEDDDFQLSDLEGVTIGGKGWIPFKASQLQLEVQWKQEEEEKVQKQVQYQRATALFHHLDVDGDGVLAACEMSCRMSDFGFTSEQILELFEKMDTDGDAKITLEEFLNGFHDLDAQVAGVGSWIERI